MLTPNQREALQLAADGQLIETKYPCHPSNYYGKHGPRVIRRATVQALLKRRLIVSNMTQDYLPVAVSITDAGKRELEI